MSLRIGPADLERIRRHGEGTFPHECCGLLLGRWSSDEREVVKLQALDNEREDSRHNRFLITPETILRADRAARAEGLDVIGFYHSHPDAPAQPSDYDREHAWPSYSYVIVSIQKGQAAELTSWTLAEERTHFNPETIVTTTEV